MSLGQIGGYFFTRTPVILQPISQVIGTSLRLQMYRNANTAVANGTHCKPGSVNQKDNLSGQIQEEFYSQMVHSGSSRVLVYAGVRVTSINVDGCSGEKGGSSRRRI